MWEKIKKVYFYRNGRISRKTYWVYSIPLGLLCLPAILASENEPFRMYDLFPLLCIYPLILISIKRSRDINKSGWFTLVLFLPIISLWPAILFGFRKGDEGINKYGEPDDIWN